MSLRLQQLRATAVVLPRVTSLVPLGCAAISSVLAIALLSSDGHVVTHARLAGALVAAASAAILDDAAAPTLASSPTTLAIRRSFRLAITAALVGGWWLLMLAVARARVDDVPITAMTRELVLLVVIAVVGALVGGSAGGLAALAWFALSHVPALGWVPLPPDPLDPPAAGPVVAVTVVIASIVLALSRDPAARWRRR